MPVLEVLFGFALLGAMALAFAAIRKTYAHSVTREDIEAQFKSTRYNVGQSRYEFAGHAVVVVYEYVDEIRNSHNIRSLGHPLMIHRVCRNSFGEYFLYISGETPFVTHMTQDRARAALRRDHAAFEREFGVQSAT
jgi:hypothetical protein